MARIFYRTATGNIYGVHPGPFSGSLPDDIDFIDVAETPSQIVWPVNASGKSGEKFAHVQDGLLVAFDPDFSVTDQATVEAAFNLTGPDRAELRLIFELVKAMKTGDQTFFDSVVSVATFKNLVRKMLR